MRIVEIVALSNGAHRNQTLSNLAVIPEGWAVIPASMETSNFPFGEITVEGIGGIPTVTSWTPCETPEPTTGALTPAEQREVAYNTQSVIPWKGEELTVTQAAQKWQYYAAAGEMEQASAITSLIAETKKEIRAQWPDQE